MKEFIDKLAADFSVKAESSGFVVPSNVDAGQSSKKIVFPGSKTMFETVEMKDEKVNKAGDKKKATKNKINTQSKSATNISKPVSKVKLPLPKCNISFRKPPVSNTFCKTKSFSDVRDVFDDPCPRKTSSSFSISSNTFNDLQIKQSFTLTGNKNMDFNFKLKDMEFSNKSPREKLEELLEPLNFNQWSNITSRIQSSKVDYEQNSLNIPKTDQSFLTSTHETETDLAVRLINDSSISSNVLFPLKKAESDTCFEETESTVDSESTDFIRKKAVKKTCRRILHEIKSKSLSDSALEAKVDTAYMDSRTRSQVSTQNELMSVCSDDNVPVGKTSSAEKNDGLWGLGSSSTSSWKDAAGLETDSRNNTEDIFNSKLNDLEFPKKISDKLKRNTLKEFRKLIEERYNLKKSKSMTESAFQNNDFIDELRLLRRSNQSLASRSSTNKKCLKLQRQGMPHSDANDAKICLPTKTSIETQGKTNIQNHKNRIIIDDEDTSENLNYLNKLDQFNKLGLITSDKSISETELSCDAQSIDCYPSMKSESETQVIKYTNKLESTNYRKEDVKNIQKSKMRYKYPLINFDYQRPNFKDKKHFSTDSMHLISESKSEKKLYGKSEENSESKNDIYSIIRSNANDKESIALLESSGFKKIGSETAKNDIDPSSAIKYSWNSYIHKIRHKLTFKDSSTHDKLFDSIENPLRNSKSDYEPFKKTKIVLNKSKTHVMIDTQNMNIQNRENIDLWDPYKHADCETAFTEEVTKEDKKRWSKTIPYHLMNNEQTADDSISENVSEIKSTNFASSSEIWEAYNEILNNEKNSPFEQHNDIETQTSVAEETKSKKNEESKFERNSSIDDDIVVITVQSFENENSKANDDKEASLSLGDQLLLENSLSSASDVSYNISPPPPTPESVCSLLDIFHKPVNPSCVLEEAISHFFVAEYTGETIFSIEEKSIKENEENFQSKSKNTKFMNLNKPEQTCNSPICNTFHRAQASGLVLNHVNSKTSPDRTFYNSEHLKHKETELTESGNFNLIDVFFGNMADTLLSPCAKEQTESTFYSKEENDGMMHLSRNSSPKEKPSDDLINLLPPALKPIPSPILSKTNSLYSQASSENLNYYKQEIKPLLHATNYHNIESLADNYDFLSTKTHENQTNLLNLCEPITRNNYERPESCSNFTKTPTAFNYTSPTRNIKNVNSPLSQSPQFVANQFKETDFSLISLGNENDVAEDRFAPFEPSHIRKRSDSTHIKADVIIQDLIDQTKKDLIPPKNTNKPIGNTEDGNIDRDRHKNTSVVIIHPEENVYELFNAISTCDVRQSKPPSPVLQSNATFINQGSLADQYRVKPEFAYLSTSPPRGYSSVLADTEQTKTAQSFCQYGQSTKQAGINVPNSENNYRFFENNFKSNQMENLDHIGNPESVAENSLQSLFLQTNLNRLSEEKRKEEVASDLKEKFDKDSEDIFVKKMSEFTSTFLDVFSYLSGKQANKREESSKKTTGTSPGINYNKHFSVSKGNEAINQNTSPNVLQQNNSVQTLGKAENAGFSSQFSSENQKSLQSVQIALNKHLANTTGALFRNDNVSTLAGVTSSETFKTSIENAEINRLGTLVENQKQESKMPSYGLDFYNKSRFNLAKNKPSNLEAMKNNISIEKNSQKEIHLAHKNVATETSTRSCEIQTNDKIPQMAVSEEFDKLQHVVWTQENINLMSLANTNKKLPETTTHIASGISEESIPGKIEQDVVPKTYCDSLLKLDSNKRGEEEALLSSSDETLKDRSCIQSQSKSLQVKKVTETPIEDCQSKYSNSLPQLSSVKKNTEAYSYNKRQTTGKFTKQVHDWENSSVANSVKSETESSHIEGIIDTDAYREEDHECRGFVYLIMNADSLDLGNDPVYYNQTFQTPNYSFPSTAPFPNVPYSYDTQHWNDIRFGFQQHYTPYFPQQSNAEQFQDSNFVEVLSNDRSKDSKIEIDREKNSATSFQCCNSTTDLYCDENEDISFDASSEISGNTKENNVTSFSSRENMRYKNQNQANEVDTDNLKHISNRQTIQGSPEWERCSLKDASPPKTGIDRKCTHSLNSNTNTIECNDNKSSLTAEEKDREILMLHKVSKANKVEKFIKISVPSPEVHIYETTTSSAVSMNKFHNLLNSENSTMDHIGLDITEFRSPKRTYNCKDTQNVNIGHSSYVHENSVPKETRTEMNYQYDSDTFQEVGSLTTEMNLSSQSGSESDYDYSYRLKTNPKAPLFCSRDSTFPCSGEIELHASRKWKRKSLNGNKRTKPYRKKEKNTTHRQRHINGSNLKWNFKSPPFKHSCGKISNFKNTQTEFSQTSRDVNATDSLETKQISCLLNKYIEKKGFSNYLESIVEAGLFKGLQKLDEMNKRIDNVKKSIKPITQNMEKNYSINDLPKINNSPPITKSITINRKEMNDLTLDGTPRQCLQLVDFCGDHFSSSDIYQQNVESITEDSLDLTKITSLITGNGENSLQHGDMFPENIHKFNNIDSFSNDVSPVLNSIPPKTHKENKTVFSHTNEQNFNLTENTALKEIKNYEINKSNYLSNLSGLIVSETKCPPELDSNKTDLLLNEGRQQCVSPINPCAINVPIDSLTTHGTGAYLHADTMAACNHQYMSIHPAACCSYKKPIVLKEDNCTMQAISLMSKLNETKLETREMLVSPEACLNKEKLFDFENNLLDLTGKENICEHEQKPFVTSISIEDLSDFLKDTQTQSEYHYTKHIKESSSPIKTKPSKKTSKENSDISIFEQDLNEYQELYVDSSVKINNSIKGGSLFFQEIDNETELSLNESCSDLFLGNKETDSNRIDAEMVKSNEQLIETTITDLLTSIQESVPVRRGMYSSISGEAELLDAAKIGLLNNKALVKTGSDADKLIDKLDQILKEMQQMFPREICQKQIKLNSQIQECVGTVEEVSASQFVNAETEKDSDNIKLSSDTKEDLKDTNNLTSDAINRQLNEENEEQEADSFFKPPQIIGIKEELTQLLNNFFFPQKNVDDKKVFKNGSSTTLCLQTTEISVEVADPHKTTNTVETNNTVLISPQESQSLLSNNKKSQSENHSATTSYHDDISKVQRNSQDVGDISSTHALHRNNSSPNTESTSGTSAIRAISKSSLSQEKNKSHKSCDLIHRDRSPIKGVNVKNIVKGLELNTAFQDAFLRKRQSCENWKVCFDEKLNNSVSNSDCKTKLEKKENLYPRNSDIALKTSTNTKNEENLENSNTMEAQARWERWPKPTIVEEDCSLPQSHQKKENKFDKNYESEPQQNKKRDFVDQARFYSKQKFREPFMSNENQVVHKKSNALPKYEINNSKPSKSFGKPSTDANSSKNKHFCNDDMKHSKENTLKNTRDCLGLFENKSKELSLNFVDRSDHVAGCRLNKEAVDSLDQHLELQNCFSKNPKEMNVIERVRVAGPCEPGFKKGNQLCHNGNFLDKTSIGYSTNSNKNDIDLDHLKSNTDLDKAIDEDLSRGSSGMRVSNSAIVDDSNIPFIPLTLNRGFKLARSRLSRTTNENFYNSEMSNERNNQLQSSSNYRRLTDFCNQRNPSNTEINFSSGRKETEEDRSDNKTSLSRSFEDSTMTGSLLRHSFRSSGSRQRQRSESRRSVHLPIDPGAQLSDHIQGQSIKLSDHIQGQSIKLSDHIQGPSIKLSTKSAYRENPPNETGNYDDFYKTKQNSVDVNDIKHCIPTQVYDYSENIKNKNVFTKKQGSVSPTNQTFNTSQGGHNESKLKALNDSVRKHNVFPLLDMPSEIPVDIYTIPRNEENINRKKKKANSHFQSESRTVVISGPVRNMSIPVNRHTRKSATDLTKFSGSVEPASKPQDWVHKHSPPLQTHFPRTQSPTTSKSPTKFKNESRLGSFMRKLLTGRNNKLKKTKD